MPFGILCCNIERKQILFFVIYIKHRPLTGRSCRRCASWWKGFLAVRPASRDAVIVLLNLSLAAGILDQSATALVKFSRIFYLIWFYLPKQASKQAGRLLAGNLCVLFRARDLIRLCQLPYLNLRPWWTRWLNGLSAPMFVDGWSLKFSQAGPWALSLSDYTQLGSMNQQ